MPYTHVGKYQARIVCDDIAGKPTRANYEAIPRVVFSDPEIAAVGLTETQARDRGIARNRSERSYSDTPAASRASALVMYP
jgi:pyruvate/2-oxoglutarate dehydrogenase complex dihydrolipoamide dehydrogenase (E3) component